MEIRSVRAHPFGPLADDELLLTSGLNVVVGDNESGKSSWHAAVTTAIGGQRSGARRKTKGDPDISRYRPWHSDDWAVSCALHLVDGRQVRLVHNLATKRSQAIDDVTGVDITKELMDDGGVDASTLVGLNRLTLPLVSSVGQADILALAAAQAKDHPVVTLRSLLQGAVSSRVATDGSADEAIARLRAMRSAQIGTERAGSSKPLRRARDEMEAARDHHQRAQAAWEDHRGAERDLVAADRQLVRVHERIAELELAQNAAQADQQRRLFSRAQGLARAATYSGPAPAPTALVQQVEQALVSLAETPAPVAPPVRSATAVAAEIANLPEAPVGDRRPHPSVTDAHTRYLAADTALVNHHATSAPPVEDAAGHGLEPDELRQIAARLDQPLHSAAPDTSAVPMAAVVLCAVLVVVAVVLGAVLQSLPFFGFAAILGVALLAGLVLTRREAPDPHHAHAVTVREADVASLLGAGITPASSAAAQAAASAIDRQRANQQRHDEWQRVRRGLSKDLASAEMGLRVALADRRVSIAPDGDPAPAVGEYIADCAVRADQQIAADRRDALNRELTAAQSAELAIETAAEDQTQLWNELDQLAAELDAAEPVPAELAAVTDAAPSGSEAEPSRSAAARTAQLLLWLERNNAAKEQSAEAGAAAGRLAELLGDRTLAELAAECPDEESVATSKKSDRPIGSSKEIAARLRQLHNDRARMETDAARLRGAREQAEQNLVGLPESRELVTRAEQEYARLTRLDFLVGAAIETLTKARQEVHRAVAPEIARVTNDRLARVSAGRYKQIRVDPEDLSVTVETADGHWQPAQNLSHGTAEQIYLLARIAIAETIAPDSEPCPLLLDDVTVHADDERTEALLELLSELSETRQVILFSQESRVREWAERHAANVVALPAV